MHAYIKFAVRINCSKKTWSPQLATFAMIAISVEGNTYFCIGMRSQVSWATACPSSLEAPCISLYLLPRNPFSPIRPTIACCSRSRAGWTQERCKHAHIQDWWVIDSLRKAMRSLSRGSTHRWVIDWRSSNAPSGITDMSLPCRDLDFEWSLLDRW